jgi:hypothetical protein
VPNQGANKHTASISVKPDYARVYDGLHFEGKLSCRPGLHHGAWMCKVSVHERPTEVTFRLGHLDKLAVDGVDLLREAQEAGWSTAVATNTREVAIWCARECAMEVLQTASKDTQRPGSTELPDLPGERDRETLKTHLGGPPDALEQALFEREFTRTLRDPTLREAFLHEPGNAAEPARNR